MREFNRIYTMYTKREREKWRVRQRSVYKNCNVQDSHWWAFKLWGRPSHSHSLSNTFPFCLRSFNRCSLRTREKGKIPENFPILEKIEKIIISSWIDFQINLLTISSVTELLLRSHCVLKDFGSCHVIMLFHYFVSVKLTNCNEWLVFDRSHQSCDYCKQLSLVCTALLEMFWHLLSLDTAPFTEQKHWYESQEYSSFFYNLATPCSFVENRRLFGFY